jgi:hypothetical protein
VTTTLAPDAAADLAPVDCRRLRRRLHRRGQLVTGVLAAVALFLFVLTLSVGS